jgi:hypothetical protein
MVKMLGCVAVFRIVAAADVAANQTFTKVNPRIAGLQAVFAAIRGGANVVNLREVWTRFYLHDISLDRRHTGVVS